VRAQRNYILGDNHQVIPEDDFLLWAKWYETADRHVGFDDFGMFQVSTVFLGVDHAFEEGRTALFETMVFERNRDDPELGLDFVQSDDFEMWRYATWAEAEAGHLRMCELVRAIRDELLSIFE
jgi:hypothetical protein